MVAHVQSMEHHLHAAVLQEQIRLYVQVHSILAYQIHVETMELAHGFVALIIGALVLHPLLEIHAKRREVNAVVFLLVKVEILNFH